MKKLILAVLIGSLVAATAQADPKAERLYQDGLKAEQKKDYQSALWNFKAASAQDPQLAQALRHAGNCAYLSKDYPGAIKYYDRYLEAKPDDKAVRDFRSGVQAMLDRGGDMAHGKLKWRSIEEGLSESRKSGKPLMYDFTAAWCGPCKKLVSEVFDNEEYAGVINKEFIPVQVVDRFRENGHNLPAVTDLKNKFYVGGFPTLAVTMPDGKEEKQVGYGGARNTMAFLVKSLRKVKGLKATGYEEKYPQED